MPRRPREYTCFRGRRVFGGRRLPRKAGRACPIRLSRHLKTECQKERLFPLLLSKGCVFKVFAGKRFFLSVPNGIEIYTLIYICLRILAKFPQYCRLFSARACAAFRNKRFFSPHRVANLSACCRIFLLIPEKILPEDGIPVCFFPHVFLFEAEKAFPVEKQNESRPVQWQTHPASFSAQPYPSACTCQAKAVSC